MDIEQERRLIEQAVAQAGLTVAIGHPDDPPAKAPGVDVVITHLDQVTDPQGQAQKASRAALQRYFREHPRPHIIHFCCHGSYDDRPPHEGVLILEQNPPPDKQQGRQDPLGAHELRTWLSDLAPDLRLVVFNACSTAPTPQVAALKSIAEAAVQAGVHAVIAMQFDIPLDIARVFALGFYSQLFKACLKEGSPIDLALVRARQDILTLRPTHKPHWGIPVLYRHPSGVEPFQLVPEGQWERARDLMDQLFFQRQQRESLQRMASPYDPSPAPAWLIANLTQVEQTIQELEDQLQALFEGDDQ
jgi:CHAT domain-containing protein